MTTDKQDDLQDYNLMSGLDLEWNTKGSSSRIIYSELSVHTVQTSLIYCSLLEQDVATIIKELFSCLRFWV